MNAVESGVTHPKARTRQPGGLFSWKTHLNIHLYSHHTSLDHLLYYETLSSRNHCTDCRRANHSDRSQKPRLSGHFCLTGKYFSSRSVILWIWRFAPRRVESSRLKRTEKTARNPLGLDRFFEFFRSRSSCSRPSLSG